MGNNSIADRLLIPKEVSEYILANPASPYHFYDNICPNFPVRHSQALLNREKLTA
jgi:hypothetical protein